MAMPSASLHEDPTHLNTPRLVADASGTTVWKWDQAEPFGANAAEKDPDGNSVAFDLPLRLPGQYYDKETGLHQNWFREYDPSLGKYAESDPIGLAGGIHTYGFANANGLTYVDPDGLIGVPGAVVGAIAGSGLYVVGQVLRGQQTTANGFFLAVAAGAASGMSGAYIYAGVARLALQSTRAVVIANMAGNAVANMGLGAVFGAANNLANGACISDDLARQAAMNFGLGAGAGYFAARLALLAPQVGVATQSLANRTGNVLLPRTPPMFTGSTGPVGSTAAGIVTGVGIGASEGVSNFSNLASTP